MADRDGHPHAGEFFGNRARLLRIARVVADFQPELLSQHAARSIDIGHGLFGAIPHLPAERRLTGGHRTGRSDRDVLRRRRSGGKH